MRVYFRFDGSSILGMGHVVRSIALSKMISQKFNKYFICKTIPISYKFFLNNLFLIEDENELFEIVQDKSILVVDSYNYPLSVLKKLKEKQVKIVIIDDLPRKNIHADIIINFTPEIAFLNYAKFKMNFTEFCLGLDYVILRKEFLKKNKEYKQNQENLFICFGGSDPQNLTQKVLRIVSADHRFNKIFIIVGEQNKKIESINKFCSNLKNVELYYNLNEIEIKRLMMRSKLVFIPSSGILNEAIALKKIIISGMYTLNQKLLYSSYKKLNAFIDAKNFSEIDIKKSIEKYFRTDDNCIQQLIDCNSPKRLKSIFDNLRNSFRFKLRIANEEDLILTYNWASSPDIRKYFFNPKPTSFEEHKNWFIKKIECNRSKYFIGLYNGKEIGSIRFELTKNKWHVSYLVDPSYQKMGFGNMLLKFGILELKSTYNIIAEVFEKNHASIKIFEKNGFKQIKQINQILTFEKYF